MILTKRNVFLVEGIGLAAVILTFIQFSVCRSVQYGMCTLMPEAPISLGIMVAMVLLLVTPFSILTAFLNEKVFKTWVWFTVIWIVTVTLFSYVARSSEVLFYAGLLYIILSSAVICVQSFRTYWTIKKIIPIALVGLVIVMLGAAYWVNARYQYMKTHPVIPINSASLPQ